MSRIAFFPLFIVAAATSFGSEPSSGKAKLMPIRKIPHDDYLISIKFSHDARYLATGTDHLSRFGGGTVQCFDVKSYEQVMKVKYRSRIDYLAWSHDDSLIAVAAGKHVLRRSTGEKLVEISASGPIEFSQDDSTIYAVRGSIRRLDAKTGKTLESFFEPTDVQVFALSPRQDRIVGAVEHAGKRSYDVRTEVRCVSLADQKVVASREIEGSCRELQWSDDGSLIFVDGYPKERNAFIWNVEADKVIELDFEFSSVNRVVNDRVVSVGSHSKAGDIAVAIYDVSDGKRLTVQQIDADAYCADISRDGRFVAASDGQDLLIYDISEIWSRLK